ncbi:MAG: hypothetical protein L6Q99_19050 [Planctomycetes bacterium]|nr:hypothetical protein [Planctomycetota bacterium]
MQSLSGPILLLCTACNALPYGAPQPTVTPHGASACCEPGCCGGDPNCCAPALRTPDARTDHASDANREPASTAAPEVTAGGRVATSAPAGTNQGAKGACCEPAGGCCGTSSVARR